jgi:type IV pilus assembly protein PilQ
MMKFKKIWIAFLIGLSILYLSLSPLAQTSEQYIDRKISLDFKDADIRNILKLIAGVAGFNIVLGEEVKGRITMRLVNVSWNEALEVILQSQSLGMVGIGNVVQISSLERLKREEEALLASKRAKERMEDLRTEMIRLKYAKANDMVPVIKIFLSERGHVSADERTNTLIIKDRSENIEVIKNLFH